MPSVAVIIVNWNSGQWLQTCLSSLRGQSRKPDAIYVVDNDSTDHSVDCVGHFEDVQLIQAKKNLGFAAANNLALSKCTTDYVALLNPDAFAKPDWLKSLLDAATQHPEFSSFGSRQMLFGQTNVLDGVGDAYNMCGLPWRQRHGLALTPQDLIPREIFSPCAAAALYRRKDIADLGGFDESFFCYIEDVDLGFRLRSAGKKSLYVPDAVVEHVGSGTTGDQSDFTLYHGHRNIVWAFVKNMPPLLFWPLLPLHVFMNLYSILHFSMIGHGLILRKAKLDAAKELPRVWQQRKRIQRERIASTQDIWRSLDKAIFPNKRYREVVVSKTQKPKVKPING